MPTINRKRRAQVDTGPSPPPTRRCHSPSDEDASSLSEASTDGAENTQASNQEQMVKKLVRLALSSEYSRTPIRRSDVTAKVMPPGTGRQFNRIYLLANEQLRATFGMELTPLPSREKTTVSQKRAAQRAGTQSQASSSNKSFILTTTLPPHYRLPTILAPAKIPSAGAEGGYAGVVSFVLALIFLSPGQSLSEARLEKHLKRLNADEYVLGSKSEDLLKKMIREGYVIKVKERDGGGEETVDWVVGPRGKVEVGERGVAGLVRKVFGKRDVEAEELDRRLVRSLGDLVIDHKRRREGGEGGEEAGEEGGEEIDREANGVSLIDDEAEAGPSRARGRPSTGRRKKARRARDEEEEEEEEEER